MIKITKEEFSNLIERKLAAVFGIKPQEASDKIMYRALCLVTKDLITQKRLGFKQKVRANGGKKQVYYMFLLR